MLFGSMKDIVCVWSLTSPMSSVFLQQENLGNFGTIC